MIEHPIFKSMERQIKFVSRLPYFIVFGVLILGLIFWWILK